jgi:hypothetical protein
LKQSDSILYLADNAGETVFDRVLIETLGFPVSYVVKAAPIINDATRKDAVAAGIDRVAEIDKNRPLENRNRARAKYISTHQESLHVTPARFKIVPPSTTHKSLAITLHLKYIINS